MKGLFCNVCKLMQRVSNSWNRKEKTNNSKSTYKSQQCSQHISSVISLWLTPAQYSHQWMFVSVSVRKWVHMQALHTQAPHRKQFLEASVKSNLKPLFATVFIHIPLLIIVQFQYEKSCMFLMCACVCKHVVSVSASVVSQPRWGNVSAAPCPGKPELWVSFAQKAVPCRHSDWCIRQPTKAYFEAYWSGDSAVFGSQLSFGAMAISVQWKMAFWFSERNLMAAMRMDRPNVFPSVCLRWNEACSRGLPPNN